VFAAFQVSVEEAQSSVGITFPAAASEPALSPPRASLPSPAGLRPWTHDLKLCQKEECTTRFLVPHKLDMGRYMLSPAEVNLTLARIDGSKDRLRSTKESIFEVQQTLNQIGRGEIKGHGTEGMLADKIAALRGQADSLRKVLRVLKCVCAFCILGLYAMLSRKSN